VDQTEVLAAILAVLSLTLALRMLLFMELRWHGRLLEEIKDALVKHQEDAPRALAPPSPRVRVEIEAELVEDSKDAWDRRLAEHEEDPTTPTLPSGHNRTPRGS